MKHWTPETLYRAKPWVLVSLGAILCIGMMIWSLLEGSWSAWRGLACFAGAALAIGGGAIFQLRYDYRARSKWRRQTPR